MPEGLSNLVFFFARPSNILVFLVFLGLVLLLLRVYRAGILAIAVASVGFVIVGFSPLATLALAPLERIYPKAIPPEAPPTGILVFGGFVEDDISTSRDVPSVNESADRIIAVADLARRYPEAIVAISDGPQVAQMAARIAETFAVAKDRIRIEDQSTSTWENAVYLKRLLDPKPDETWLVVTSAWHMPRTVGILETAGWTGLVPWPVDYRTPVGEGLYDWTPSAADGLYNTNLAAREWLSLLAYWMTGKTPALLPGPIEN
ncbi:YdcF family protein [Amorphus sp. 3PC139-8]|uniref:YdcF family protein n=1 Tax=Amorphus sp. 3PC139-8 TaxID=2735676 RepID=UPI00345D08DC